MQADIRLVDLIGALASYRRKGKSSSVGASVGAVAGLVCITPGAGFVTPGWSIAIGALGAVWCYASVEIVNKARSGDGRPWDITQTHYREVKRALWEVNFPRLRGDCLLLTCIVFAIGEQSVFRPPLKMMV